MPAQHAKINAITKQVVHQALSRKRGKAVKAVESICTPRVMAWKRIKHYGNALRLVRRKVRSFVRSFVCVFGRSVVRSVVRLFVRSLGGRCPCYIVVVGASSCCCSSTP